MSTLLFHIVERSAWHECRGHGSYAPASLQGEGFIHLSTPTQLLGTAARFYAEVEDLVVLAIDSRRLQAELREEPADGQLFPHLYGPLNLDAVVEVIPLVRTAAGVFLPVKAPELQ